MIEVVVATGILALSLIPIFSFISSSGFASRKQKAEINIANLAKEEMNRWLYEFPKSKFDAYFTAHPTGNFAIPWSLDNPFLIEGNVFQGFIKLQKHVDATVPFSYPELNWHPFHISCPNKVEGNDWSAGTLSPPTPFKEQAKKLESVANSLSLPSAGQYHIVDILLQIKWRLPNEPDFSDTGFKEMNQFLLVSRRFFL